MSSEHDEKQSVEHRYKSEAGHTDHEYHGTTRVQDEASKVLAHAQDQPPITPEEERALLRKVDLYLMPMLCITAGLQFADKSSLSTAALFGLVQALRLYKFTFDGLDTHKYSQAAMIFGVGYIAGVLPLSLLAQRFPTGRVCAVFIILWGLCVILTPLCTSFEGLMAQRFFLGFMESGVSPAFLSVLGMWYTKREQAMRGPIIYSANGFLLIPILGISWAIVQIGPEADAWKSIFYLLGTTTIVWGFVVLWILPDDPIRAKFLNERERYVAIERLRGNQAGVTSKHVRSTQALSAFKDPKVILLTLMMFTLCCPGGAVSAFSPLVLQRVYSASPRRVLLLLMPSAAVAGVSSLIAGYVSFHIRNARCAVIIFFAGTCLIGSALEWKLPLSDKRGILAGLYLMSSYSGSVGTLTGLVASNIAGATKKTVTGSLVFLMLALASVASPFFFLREEQPRYPTGFKTTLALLGVGIGLTFVYSMLCVHENRKREAELARNGPPAQDNAFSDMTDTENKAFRYTI